MVGPQQTQKDSSTTFDLLSHQCRRDVLDLLTEAGHSQAITALATEIVDGENVAPPASGRQSQINDVQIALYHIHLPKLADGGLIKFDPDRKTAERTRVIQGR